MTENRFDTVIIGGGVVGSAVARELSRYELSVCLVEKEEDVCSGTSKANSAIVHAGFDAYPGSNKARFNVEGNRMMETLSKELDFEFQRNGSVVLCFDEVDMPKLQELTARAKLPSPEFHDLGETEESTVTNPAFRIECKALGKTAVGIGRSKTEARAAAIAEILKDVKPETAAKNSKPNAKKATQTVAKQPKAKADKPKAKTVEKAKETDNRKKTARGSKGGATLKK